MKEICADVLKKKIECPERNIPETLAIKSSGILIKLHLNRI